MINNNYDMKTTEFQKMDNSVDELSKLVAENNQLLEQLANRSNLLKRFAIPIISVLE